MNDDGYIPYGKQNINDDDIKAVNDVLKSKFITQGPITEEFEKRISTKVNSRFAISTNSATSALHISCLALGLKKGDYLWTTPNTFVASANCALYCGANIDFVDINIKTGLLSIEHLKEKLLLADKKGNLPKIIVPVHFSGASCEMEELKKLKDKYGFSIIEDGSHSIGGKYHSYPVGSCKYSDITVFSFHPVKIITTGEGGMITTNNENLFIKLRTLRSHGITKDPNKFKSKNKFTWSYEQQLLGFNYRMSDINAALGISQLERLDDIVAERNKLFSNYNNLLKDMPLRLLEIPENITSSVHLAVILINEDIKHQHEKIFNLMRSSKIGVQLHYIPVHTQPFFKELGFKDDDYPISLNYSKRAMSIPLFIGLSESDQEYVSVTLRKHIKSSYD